jgi:hypothetical protein
MIFFYLVDRLESHRRMGDPLQAFNDVFPWEGYLGFLMLVHDRERKTKTDCKPLDGMLMFNPFFLERLYNLSDAQVEFQIRD